MSDGVTLSMLASVRDDVLAAIAAHRADTDKMRADIMARIDRLQSHTDQMADAAFVTYAQGEGIETRLSGLLRQVRRLTARMDELEAKE